MNSPSPPPVDLVAFAFRAMRENGFEPEPPPAVARELAALREGASLPAGDGPPPPRCEVRDLRALPWSSIDNPESRDLDQLEVAARCAGGDVRVLLAIADVDVEVPRGSALDAHAAHNATSVYTGPVVFAMLPELLSTDRTSLGEGDDRRAMVCELLVGPDGAVKSADVYPAVVHNHAKLAYDEVAAWLESPDAPPPAAVRACPALGEQLRLQDEVAQRLKALRHARGALDLETIEARPVTVDGRVVDLKVTQKNRARELIEDLMLAANSATARFLEDRGFASIRRVVKTPERWRRIAALAAGLGEALPAIADPLALARFLARRKAAEPDRFADLSLSVVKLLGPGEYALERMGESAGGHFGLAVEDYTHSTAPNRRYADLVTQRLLKAAVAAAPPPYTDEQLAAIAARCTERANSARKVERLLRKEVAIVLLAPRVGELFDAIVTGVTGKGTFVRLLAPPAEGRVVRGEQELDVGDRLKVRLVAIDPDRGYVDFAREE